MNTMPTLAEDTGINPGATKYGGFWMRVAAALLDGVFLAIIHVCAMFVTGSITGFPLTDNTQLVLLIFRGMTYLGYETFFIGKWGATPGKMVCCLKVVTAGGGPVSYLLAFARSLGKILSASILCLGFLIIGFDRQKRGLHDYLCGTRVIDIARKNNSAPK